jgi:type I restriction enzyme S subunit
VWCAGSAEQCFARTGEFEVDTETGRHSHAERGNEEESVMIEQLAAMPKYEAYKDSGVEWLGEIPAHWVTKKLKYIGEIYAGLAGKKGDDFSKEPKAGFLPFVPFTSIANATVVAQRYQYVSVRPYEEQSFVKANDILFLMSSETLDDIAKCSLYIGDEQPLYLNSFCKGFRIKSKNSSPKFINYLLQSDNYRYYFGTVARGFTRINLKQEFVNGASVLLPPLFEQTAISAFLDSKIAQIDQAVAIKEKQIALLKERKQILIQNAVTRGLNPDAPMHDSGVEWIGEIPAHWSCSRLKMHSKVQSGITLGKSYIHKNFVEMPYIRVANVQNGYFKLDDIALISLPRYEIPRYLLQNGDILVTEGGDIDKLGRGTVWRDEIKPCLHQNHVFAIRVNQSILDQDFVSNFLATDMARKYFINTATKTTNLASTNRTHLGNLYLPIPSLKEQLDIVVYIETESAKIDQAISIQQQQIGKLKEYKATLINSAVTGKIKVPDC